jgi:NAD+ kinase
MKIGLFFRKRIDNLIRMAHNIASFVAANGSEIVIAPELQDVFPQHRFFDSLQPDSKPDVLISLGGDGTFLHAAQYALLQDIPLVGINFGFTGFLTNIEKEEIFQSLESIIQKKFHLKEIASLKGTIYRNGEVVKHFCCLNDFVLQKDPIEKILTFDLYLNTLKIASYRGDGLIVSTPSGSTAYSLSAGGPIIDPTCSVYLLTPLCSHKISGRSLVVNDSDKCFINVFSKGDKTRFIRDGSAEYIVKDLDRIMIQRNYRSLKMMMLEEKNFYQTLNQKFQWGF